MKIAYIGKKPLKKDTISGSRMVFPRFEALEVEKEYALRLLQFPTVFVEEKYLENAKKQFEETEQAKAQAEKEKAEHEQAEIAAQSRELVIDGQTVDVGKLTKAKLDTLVESQDLDIEKGVNESVPDYRERVFAALSAKVGQ